MISAPPTVPGVFLSGSNAIHALRQVPPLETVIVKLPFGFPVIGSISGSVSISIPGSASECGKTFGYSSVGMFGGMSPGMLTPIGSVPPPFGFAWTSIITFRKMYVPSVCFPLAHTKIS